MTNRALVAASLARPGASRISGGLEADDTWVMRQGLRQLGTLIDDNDDPWMVLGTGGTLTGGEINVGASGTTSRFLTAVAALATDDVNIDGTKRLRERPIRELVEALRSLGATIDGQSFPLRIRGGHLSGTHVEIDASRSSQFVSALLLISPMLAGPVTVRPVGERASESYIQGTLDVMTAFGAQVDRQGESYVVQPTGYRKAQYEVEADASAAVYPMVAAAISGGTIRINGLASTSIQPDIALVDVLEKMGCSVRRLVNELIIQGPSGPLRAICVDMSSAPDAALALAVACLFADGPSRISGLGTLRVKETDRLSALETEIRRLGAEASTTGDELSINPGPLHPADIQTYDDHRMAMSFALVGLLNPGTRIVDPGCVSKTWPDFFITLATL